MRLDSPKINTITKACLKASKSIIRDFGEIEKLQVSSKGPGDFVSSADKRTEKILISELQKAQPDYEIITEESGVIAGTKNNCKWIIDPIDGTTNFLNGIPQFAISVGYEEDNEIKCGVVFDPIKNEMFIAEKGNGAYLNNSRIRVSKKNKIEECLFVMGGKNNIEPNFLFRKSGCAALDMAYVASGRYDGYFQKNLNIWDVAAGILLVKEAGGIVNKIDLSKNKNIKIIASSANINPKLLEKLDNF